MYPRQQFQLGEPVTLVIGITFAIVNGLIAAGFLVANNLAEWYKKNPEVVLTQTQLIAALNNNANGKCAANSDPTFCNAELIRIVRDGFLNRMPIELREAAIHAVWLQLTPEARRNPILRGGMEHVAMQTWGTDTVMKTPKGTDMFPVPPEDKTILGMSYPVAAAVAAVVIVGGFWWYRRRNRMA